MATGFNSLSEAIQLCNKVDYPIGMLPNIVKLKQRIMSLGLIGLEDAPDGGLISIHWSHVEAMMFCQNVPVENLGGWLWHQGYLIFPEKLVNKSGARDRYVFRVDNPDGKLVPNRFSRLVDAGIFCLKDAIKRKLKYVKPELDD